MEAAAKLSHAAVSAAPRNARAHFLLGAVEQRAGRTQEAAAHTLRAARLRPDLAALQTAAGALLCRGKAYAEALEVFEVAVNADPSNGRYHLGGELFWRRA